MNPIEQQAWKCEHCGMRFDHREDAEKCCVCSKCGTQTIRFSLCNSCSTHADQEAERIRLDKAELVDNTYEGPVFYDNKYYNTLDELIDYLWDQDFDWPEYVHTAQQVNTELCILDILENLELNLDLEDTPDWNGTKELEEAIKTFNKANKWFEYYEEDSKHKIRVPSKSQVAGA